MPEAYGAFPEAYGALPEAYGALQKQPAPLPEAAVERRTRRRGDRRSLSDLH